MFLTIKLVSSTTHYHVRLCTYDEQPSMVGCTLQRCSPEATIAKKAGKDLPGCFIYEGSSTETDDIFVSFVQKQFIIAFILGLVGALTMVPTIREYQCDNGIATSIHGVLLDGFEMFFNLPSSYIKESQWIRFRPIWTIFFWTSCAYMACFFLSGCLIFKNKNTILLTFYFIFPCILMHRMILELLQTISCFLGYNVLIVISGDIKMAKRYYG